MHPNAVFCFKAGPPSVALLPFLYQTRTLALLFHQQVFHQHATRRAVHQSAEDASSPTTDSQASSFKISRVDPEYGQTAKDYAAEVASYPTFTEWRRSQLQSHLSSLETSHQQSHIFSKSNIDQYDPVSESAEETGDTLDDFGDSNAQEEYDMNSYRPGAPPKESTITESEKEAFNRIFSDIFKKLKGKDEATDPYQKNASLLVPNKRDAQETTVKLMDLAVKDATETNRREPVSFKPKEATGKPLDVDKRLRAEIEKYPPSLRQAASRALASVARRDVLDSGM